MKNTFLLISGILALSISANAQTINIDELTPQIGDIYTQGVSVYVEPGEPGEDQTWDLSGLSATQTFVATVSEPAGLPGSENFPNASYALVAAGQAQIGYSQVHDNRIEAIGIYQPDALITFPNPQTELQFPLIFGALYFDTFERLVDFYDFENQEEGTLSVMVDGSGTLVTPTGTYTDVLRLKQDIVSDVVLIMDGETDPPTHFTSTTYTFVKAGYNIALASLVSIEFGGQPSSFGTFLIDSNVGLDQLSPVSDLHIFPMPIVNDFTISLYLESSADVSFNLFSVDGRMIAQLDKTYLPAGDNTQSLSLRENTASGIYLLQIQTPESTITKKIVVH